MSQVDINYFLVIYDIAAGEAVVESFEGDDERALAAYEAAERKHRRDGNVEVVLLGSDSIETLKRTHASYFRLKDRHLDQVVARELEALLA